ncbi:DUF2071 domain-containing protein [Pollutibacter soli]|uniref:YqjF family protein n=1 Tax=Pollutibacter soli TaxID=3034157 RepID=UPI0030134039
MASNFLTAEWRKLAIANYSVDPKILLPFLPYKTEFDTWNGDCYVSLVGFRFINTRLKGFSIPFHKHFEEVNLRFYVRYKDTTGWRRGVTFIKEIVPKPALTFVANAIYKEKYVTLPMKHQWNVSDTELSVSYSWRHRKFWNNFKVIADPQPQEIVPDSEEEFITEHYWGYAPVNQNCSSQYQVEHPRWKVYPVKEYSVNVQFDQMYGNEFSMLNTRQPDSVMLAEGSEIAVLSMTKLKD